MGTIDEAIDEDIAGSTYTLVKMAEGRGQWEVPFQAFKVQGRVDFHPNHTNKNVGNTNIFS